jgi:hypothetical protein
MDVTIAAFEVDNWQYGGAAATLRLYYDTEFEDSTGQIVMPGVAGSASFFQSVACTVNTSTKVLTVPSFTLPSTTDGRPAGAKVRAVFFDSKGTRRDDYFSDFDIPHTLGASVTVGQVWDYNHTSPRAPHHSGYYDADQVNSIVAQRDTLLDAMPTSTTAALPATGTAGRLRRLTDAVRGLVFDTGTRWVNALMGNVCVEEYATLSAMIADIGATERTVYVPADYAVSASVIVPENITLKFTGSGRLTVAAGQTVTVAGAIHAPTRQIFAGAGAVLFTGNTKLKRGQCTPQWWGAKADGVTDDTVPCRSALAAALSAWCALFFPAGRYLLTGSGTEIFLQTKVIEVYGAGKTASVLVIDSAVPNTRDVFRIYPPTWALPARTNGEPSTYGMPAGRDNHGYHFHDFGIEAENADQAEAANALSVLPGRDAFRFDVSGARQYLHDSVIARVKMHALGGHSINFHNDNGAGSWANTDGIFRVTVRECWIHDGIYGTFAGDSLNILDNTFRGYNAAFDTSFVTGVGNLQFVGNNITSNGGVSIRNGANLNISHNFIELYKVDRDGTAANGAGGACLDLLGDVAQVDTVDLRGNIFGSLNGNSLHGVKLTNCREVQLDLCTFNVPVGTYGVFETAGATNVIYGFLRVTGGGTLTNNAAVNRYFALYGQSVAPSAPQPGYLSVEHVLATDLYLGSTPSNLPGNVNLSNGTGVSARNFGNTDNVEVAGCDTDNKVKLGNNSAGIVLRPLTGGVAIGATGTGTALVTHGVATLVAGVAVVAAPQVTASSRISLTGQDNNVTGAPRVSARSAGVGFTVTSSVGGDSGVVMWEIIEPA